MIELYEKYLELISQNLLQKYFEDQKDYIHCKLGCSYCCEAGQYPFSDVEFQYAMIGYNALNKDEKLFVQEKIKKIKEAQSACKSEDFMYECPFLIDKKCSIYKHRGLICRTHGLLFYITDENGDSRNKIPKCVHLGLNYSNVYDEKLGMISEKLCEESGLKAKPKAYNLYTLFLLNNSLTKKLGLHFGKEKNLIDWL